MRVVLEALHGRSGREVAESEAGRRGVERLVFFSDAVVAIAITFVVLPLVDSARDLGDESVLSFLDENAYALVAAGISFGAIADVTNAEVRALHISRRRRSVSEGSSPNRSA